MLARVRPRWITAWRSQAECVRVCCPREFPEQAKRQTGQRLRLLAVMVAVGRAHSFGLWVTADMGRVDLIQWFSHFASLHPSGLSNVAPLYHLS